MAVLPVSCSVIRKYTRRATQFGRILGNMNATERTEKQKMLRGELYRAMDPELVLERHHAESQLALLNVSVDPAQRSQILNLLLGAIGEQTTVRSPFFCDYGYNIFLGRDVFVNFNCVMLDVGEIHVGDETQIGPAVQIYAADHPRDRVIRREARECGKPVMVGKNVWIGGGAVLLPGVTIGDDAIIGAGSVVTRDVPPGATAAGNPARLLQVSGSGSSLE
jgi:maltose O-acetyltransferase